MTGAIRRPCQRLELCPEATRKWVLFLEKLYILQVIPLTKQKKCTWHEVLASFLLGKQSAWMNILDCYRYFSMWVLAVGWKSRGARRAGASENPSQGLLGLQKHDMKSHHCSIKIKCQRHVTNLELVLTKLLAVICHYCAWVVVLVLCSRFFSSSLVSFLHVVRITHIQIMMLYLLDCFPGAPLWIMYSSVDKSHYFCKKKRKRKKLRHSNWDLYVICI